MADLIKTSLQACFEKKSTLKINCWNLNVHKIKLQKSKLQKFKVHGIEMALNKITSALMKTEKWNAYIDCFSL